MAGAGKRILFWSEKHRPHDFAYINVGPTQRGELAAILAKGVEVEAWKGNANCRICARMLGSLDVGSHGFVWPERAEHYVLEHGVWTSGCQALLAAATRL